MSPAKQKSRVTDIIHETFLGLAGLVLLGMTAFILAGVWGRYVLNDPIPGVTELIGEGLIVAAIYLALSSAHHIRVSLVVSRLSEGTRRVIDYFVVGICAGVLLLAVWPAAEKALGAYRSGEATTGLVTFQLWPYRAIIVVGVALTAIRAIERGRSWLYADESGMHDAPEPDLEGSLIDPKSPDQDA